MDTKGGGTRLKLEYRLHGNSCDEEVFTNELINTVSVGSEGCIYQLPAISRIVELKRKAAEHHKKFSIVLPKLPQKFLNTAVNIIKHLNNDGTDYILVSNDYGFLYHCKKIGILPQRVCIGRSISRTFEDCLWYEHILRNEDDFNKKTMIQNNMYDEDKKSFLEKFNVIGVECNMLQNQKDSYANLSKLGYQVNVYYKYVSVAFSRACQTAKYYGTETGNCSHLCSKPINITMNKIWTRDAGMEAKEKKVNNRIADLNPEFILYGNVLYRKSKDELQDISFDYVDNLIFDSRFVSLSDVEAIFVEKSIPIN